MTLTFFKSQDCFDFQVSIEKSALDTEIDLGTVADPNSVKVEMTVSGSASSLNSNEISQAATEPKNLPAVQGGKPGPKSSKAKRASAKAAKATKIEPVDPPSEDPYDFDM